MNNLNLKLRWCVFSGMNELRKVAQKKVLNKNIIIKNIDFNDHQINNHPQFPNAENIIVDGCDKNYVYYYVDEFIFSKTNNLYLMSHPCDPKFFNRFTQDNQRVYLSDHYRNYKNRWASDNDNIILLNNEVLEKYIDNVETETTIIKD